MKTILAALFVATLSTSGFASEANHNGASVISTLAKSVGDTGVRGFENSSALGFSAKNTATRFTGNNDAARGADNAK